MADAHTIILTGGTGYLGSRLLRKLVDERKDVILLKRSTSDMKRIQGLLSRISVYDIDRDPIEPVFKEHVVDCIIHCAAEQGRGSYDPGILVESNIRLPLRLLHLGWEHNVTCFINADTILDKNINAYALSKHQFREWLRSYSSRMTCLNIAMELFYGPGDQPEKFVTSVIRELLKNAEEIELTAGEQKRDFVYIDDVVDAFIKVIEHSRSLGRGYWHYAVGTGRTRSVRDIVTMIKTLSGNTRTVLKFGARPYREHEVMDSPVDISELAKIGWQPRVTLRDGLQLTVQAEQDAILKE